METEIIDLSNEKYSRQVLNKGSITFTDIMPREVPVGRTADVAIVQAARTSTGGSIKTADEDRKLIEYLWKNQHTSPFEMVELKFEAVMPIHVARQWIRHRTANVNEYSGRYSEMLDYYYHPDLDQIKGQDTVNRQGSNGDISDEDREWFKSNLIDKSERDFELYREALKRGISKETSRLMLGINVYTKWVWKNDLHNTLKFLALRMDDHAQWEIRQYAYNMYEMMYSVLPLTMSVFFSYTLSEKSIDGYEQWTHRKYNIPSSNLGTYDGITERGNNGKLQI